jgi:hypothetical protein
MVYVLDVCLLTQSQSDRSIIEDTLREITEHYRHITNNNANAALPYFLLNMTKPAHQSDWFSIDE